jgi:hypothetical protein
MRRSEGTGCLSVCLDHNNEDEDSRVYRTLISIGLPVSILRQVALYISSFRAIHTQASTLLVAESVLVVLISLYIQI